MLCLASYEKGEAFLRECKRQGCRVLLITVEKLRDASWPRDAIDEVFYMPDSYSRDDIIKGVSFLARTQHIDRIVPLDEYDQETAALLREHLRNPGMGDTTARYFRDKLAMRVKARTEDILVPDFVHVLNYDSLREFMFRVAPPWVLKPRSEAASMGIKKISASEELWPLLDALGDRQSFYVLEQYLPGDIYHVDSIVFSRRVMFAVHHQYGHPPMDVSLGGIFTTRKIPRDSPDATAAPSSTARASSGASQPAEAAVTACTGTDQNRTFFLNAAQNLDWPVYCPVLPARWYVTSGTYSGRGVGQLSIGYKGPAGATLTLQQGGFCETSDGCVPAGTDSGEAAYGDRQGTLVTLDDGGYAIVVGRADTPSWLAASTGMDEATFRQVAEAFVRLD